MPRPLLFLLAALSLVACNRRSEVRVDTGERLRGADVAVMGMIHSEHRTSTMWGLEQVRKAIDAFEPDVILAEIPPDRWARIRNDFEKRGVFEDERIKVFPEYTDLILAYAQERGIEVVPCAAWTSEMSDERQGRMREFEEDEAFAAPRAEYEQRLAAVQAAHLYSIDDADDPQFIHSAAYDRRIAEELDLYDEYLNDHIGAGGWSNINAAHLKLIHAAIDERPGQRMLVTFGAGHKYKFLESLAGRDDINLIDLQPFMPKFDYAAQCEKEVRELHQFFQDWFNAELEDTDAVYARFEGVLADTFEITRPDGVTTAGPETLEGLRAAHGSRVGSGFRIEVRNLQVESLGEGKAFVTYEEWPEVDGQQFGWRSEAVMNRKLGAPNGLEWIVVTEHWIQRPPQ